MHSQQAHLMFARQSAQTLTQGETLQTQATLLPLVQQRRPRPDPHRGQTPQHAFWDTVGSRREAAGDADGWKQLSGNAGRRRNRSSATHLSSSA